MAFLPTDLFWWRGSRWTPLLIHGWNHQEKCRGQEQSLNLCSLKLFGKGHWASIEESPGYQWLLGSRLGIYFVASRI